MDGKSSKIKYAVIGTSEIARNYIEAAQSTDLWELVAVYSRKQETGFAFAKQYGVSDVYTNLELFAKSVCFTAVYIASPNAFHYEQSKLLLEHGKHVICEKPVAMYEWQLKELYEIAEQNGLIFLEAMMFMHQPNKDLIKERIADVGPVSMAFFDASKRSSRYDTFLAGETPNIFSKDMQAGGLMDMGIYSLYPALYYFGEPDCVDAAATILRSDVDGCGSITLKYTDKVVNVRYSKIGSTSIASEIQGEQGTIHIGTMLHVGDISIQDKHANSTQLASEESKTVLMAREAKSFYSFIEQEKEKRESYLECKRMSLLVCKYLEKIRKEIGLEF
ncbi:MAG: Gfo/Idh/MocA family oxidoreductase [Lachnospiraceae bacterium]